MLYLRLPVTILFICVTMLSQAQSSSPKSTLIGQWQFDHITNDRGSAIDIASNTADTIPLFFDRFIFTSNKVKLKADGGAWFRNYIHKGASLQIDLNGSFERRYTIVKNTSKELVLRRNLGTLAEPVWIIEYYKRLE